MKIFLLNLSIPLLVFALLLVLAVHSAKTTPPRAAALAVASPETAVVASLTLRD